MEEPPTQAAPDTAQAAPDQAQDAPERSIGELVSTIMEQISSLVRGEVDYAIANAKAKGTELGLGGGLFAAAGVLALYAFLMILLAAVDGIASVLPRWAGFLIVGVVLLAAAGILVSIGKAHMEKSKDYEIDPKAGVDRSIDAVKTGFKR